MRRTKVLPLSLFDKERVLGPAVEPMAVAGVEDGFVTATRQGRLVLYSTPAAADTDAVEVHSVAAVHTTIHDVQYLRCLDALVTVEQHSDQQDVRVCRMYMEWRLPTPPRVVAVPVMDSVVGVALGGGDRGRLIAVATLHACSIWRLELHGAAWSPVRLATVRAGFPIRHVALEGPFLAFASAHEVCAYHLPLEATGRTAPRVPSSPRPPSPVPDPAHPHRRAVHVARPPAAASDVGRVAYTRGSQGLRLGRPSGLVLELASLPSTQAAVWTPTAAGERAGGGVGEEYDMVHEFSSAAVEERGPQPLSHSVSVNAAAGVTAGKGATRLLYRRWEEGETHLIHVSLVADPEDPATAHLAGFARAGCSAGPRARLALGDEFGMTMYTLGVRDVALMTTWRYTGRATGAMCTPSFVYCMTESSLETWTHRAYEHAMGLEYPHPCLVGMQSFIGVEAITATDNHLILLSKAHVSPRRGKQRRRRSQRTPPRDPLAPRPPAEGWNLYIVHPTPLVNLVDEISSLAGHLGAPDPSTFYQLLLEAYLLLRHHLKTLALSQAESNDAPGDEASVAAASHVSLSVIDDNDGGDLAVTLADRVENSVYQTLLCHTSRRIALHLLRRRVPLLAAYFFAQSDCSVSVVWGHFARALSGEALTDNEDDLISVFDDAPGQTSIDNAAFATAATQALTRYLDCALFSPAMMHRVDAGTALADSILRHYHTHAAHRLPAVILRSCMQTYTQTLAISLLQSPPLHEVPDAALALALLLLDTGDIDAATPVLARVPADDVADFLVENPDILYDDQCQDSHEDRDNEDSHSGDGDDDLLFAQMDDVVALVLSTHPEAMTRALLALVVESPQIPVEAAITMLSASPSSHASAVLEPVLLAALGSVPGPCTEPLAVQLAHLYLARITCAEGPDRTDQEQTQALGGDEMPAFVRVLHGAWEAAAPAHVAPHIRALERLAMTVEDRTALASMARVMAAATCPAAWVLPVQLICVARQGRLQDAVALLLHQVDGPTFEGTAESVLELCITAHPPAHAQRLYEAFLDALNIGQGDDDPPACVPAASRQHVFLGTLRRIALEYPPETVLALLPAQGRLGVFLPILHQSMLARQACDQDLRSMWSPP